MARYTFEFKKEVVNAYLNRGGGTKYLSRKYNIACREQLRSWIKMYQAMGDEGLMRSRKNQNYSFEHKLHVVELYLTSEVSYQELALQEGIRNFALISNWINRFRVTGPDAFRPHKKGSKKTMDKQNKENLKSDHFAAVDTNSKHVRELEDELLKLRIENVFLKELTRLRLEDEAKMRDLPESSTASEDNSN